MSIGDIDVDTPTSFDPRALFPGWARASVARDGRLTPHPCGVHPQRVAVDPVTGLSAVPYEEAEELGYAKVDFLHLGIYDAVRSRPELEELAGREPDWALLRLPSVQDRLFQLAKHGDLLDQMQPKSLEELADALALIRPGKRQLLGLYLRDRAAGRKLLWRRGEDGYSFKRSHAFAYALVIVVQLHLIEQDRL